MDYTEINRIIRMAMKAQGVDEKYIDKEETLYYDESGNVKHLAIKDGKLNADFDTVFVLGGIQANETISIEELNKALDKNSKKEMKSTKDLKGPFIEILRKKHFHKILQLINDKRWHIHFNVVQVLYYGFVDIVDSINGLEIATSEFKAELYNVLKKDPNATISIFKKYKYPNIASKDISDFLSELTKLIEDVIPENSNRTNFEPLLFMLKSKIEKAKEQKELTFIQNEIPHEWVGKFDQFYKQQILSYPKKTLVFDEERQVMNVLANEDITLDGKALNNYSFKESGTDPMIQVCDYVVSILRKYMIFLDRSTQEIDADLQNFDEKQMNNYKLLNRMLANSLKYNPLFVHFIASRYTVANYHRYVNKYGVSMVN